MKNRKRIVVCFLICAMLLLGVGFAAINGELVIKGELGSALQKSDVVFTNVNVQWTDHNTNDGSTVTTSVERTPVATSGSDVALGGDAGLTTVSISATGLAETADVAVFTFTIENRNEVAMQVTPSFVDTDLDKFVVTSDWNGTPKTIVAGGTETYTVTIKLEQAIVETSSEVFTIRLNATSVAP